MKTYSVTTMGADGKTTTEQVPMSVEMAELFDALSKQWAEIGCRCKPHNPDHIRTEARGHSVDVFCTDCHGVVQIG